MAYTIENNYTGNNTTTLYSFTFPYLDTTDIKVSLDQVDQTLTTHYTLASPTQISFVSAPGTGVAIRIYRDTDISNLQSEFFSGSAVRAQDLNDDFNQTLYVSQETQDKVDGHWNNTTDTIDSTEAFADVNTKIMTAAAIDDRIIAKQAARALADGKIIVGNGAGVGAQVTPSGDVTMANTGAFTIATGAVEHAMLAGDAVDGDNIANDAVDSEHYVDGSVDHQHLSNDCIDGDNIQDDVINSEHYAAGSIDHEHLANDIIDGDNIQDDVINSEHYAAGSIDHEHLANDIIDGDNIQDDVINSEHIAAGAIDLEHMASSSVDSDNIVDDTIVNADINSSAAIAHSKLAAVPDGQIIVGNGSTVPTAVAVSGDVTIANTGAVTIANDAVEIGMIGCEQTTITDSDSHIPTSGAVVDYVGSIIAPIGGLEVIADDESFPNTIPAAGVVISITDCAGLSVNSSGVSTNGDALDNSTITINGFPSELRGGVGSNPDPYVFQSGAGLMVVSTGASQTYNYHQAMIREADFVQLSDDINDFNSRYRVSAGEPGSGNDEGDLVYDTNADKMKVYDSSTSAWKEVTSTGDFKYLFLCPAGGTGAPTLNGSIATYDLRESSNSGSSASVTSAAQLLVSINGVVQKANTGTSAPAEGFALVDANTIIFGANLESGDSVFIVQSGSAVSIPTPGDGTVTAAKIGAGAVTTAKIGADAVDATKIGDDVINSEHIAAGAVDLEHMSSQSVDEDNLYIDNAGSNGQVLTKQSGGTGGLLWADASGGGAVGGGSDKIFMENGQTVTTNYTIGTEFGAACNALTAGPVTINNGITVTVDSGDYWIIV